MMVIIKDHDKTLFHSVVDKETAEKVKQLIKQRSEGHMLEKIDTHNIIASYYAGTNQND